MRTRTIITALICATLSALALISALVSCDKTDKTLSDLAGIKAAQIESVDYYTADNIYRGIKWIDTTTGEVLRTTWDIENQADMSYSLRHMSVGDTLNVITTGKLCWVENSSNHQCDIKGPLTSTGISSMLIDCDSLQASTPPEYSNIGINLYRGKSGAPLSVHQAGEIAVSLLLQEGDASASYSYSDITLEKYASDSYTSIMTSADGDNDAILHNLECSVSPWTESYGLSPMISYGTTYGTWSEITINGEIEDDCHPIRPDTGWPYYFRAESWTIVGNTTRSYDLTEAPSITDRSFDGYDEACDANVSFSVAFPTGFDNESIASVYVDWGCSDVAEHAKLATKVSGNAWHAKLRTRECLDDCAFVWRVRVVYCDGTLHETTTTSATDQEFIYCGTCYRR